MNRDFYRAGGAGALAHGRVTSASVFRGQTDPLVGDRQPLTELEVGEDGEADGLWDARIAERWLGGFEGEVDDGEEWDRIIILGQWQGCWFAAALLVDGNGAPRLVAGRRNLGSEAAAWRTYRQWR